MKMIHITNLQVHERNTPSTQITTGIPNSAAKPWSFLCQNCRDKMYNEVSKLSQESNHENDEEDT